MLKTIIAVFVGVLLAVGVFFYVGAEIKQSRDIKNLKADIVNIVNFINGKTATQPVTK